MDFLQSGAGDALPALENSRERGVPLAKAKL